MPRSIFSGVCLLNIFTMIDIFELDRFIKECEPLNMDTIVMSIKDRERVDEYVKDGKYKGWNIVALSIVPEGRMEAGNKPVE